jgi:UDP:flavonoid glycosyltransferase YjiC (YdhE family)
MARVLAYTSPGRSHLFPLTPILDELQGRGHQIVLRTLSSQVGLMRSRGFDASPISPPIEALEHDDWRTRNPLQSVRLNARVFCERAEHDAPDLAGAIAETHPDAVLVDINSWGALMAAEAWGGPWAAFCPYPLALHSHDAPPYGPGFAPARGPLGHMRDRLVRPILFGVLERQFRPALNGIRERLGLAPVASLQEALAEEPVTVVATLPAGDPAGFEVPPNAHVERFVSHLLVLEHAACAITHGGMGSTQKALAHGVPVCAVPFGRDQLEVARRVEVSRAGTRLLATRLRPDRLRAKVTEAMGCAEGAQLIAAAFAATGGPPTAADAFETRLLRQHVDHGWVTARPAAATAPPAAPAPPGSTPPL